MTAAEQITQLKTENATLRAALAAAQQQVACLSERLRDLEQRLAKDGHNSSKPPSSDGLNRRPQSQRVPSERQSGEQPGHAGQKLARVAVPDIEVQHRPGICSACQYPLEGVDR